MNMALLLLCHAVWSLMLPHTHTHTQAHNIPRVTCNCIWIWLDYAMHIPHQNHNPTSLRGHYTISELWPFLATAANTVYPQLASAVFLANTRMLTQGVTQPQSHTHTCTTTTH